MNPKPWHHIVPDRKPVTLARVWGVNEGQGYTTVDFIHEEDRRGDYMRKRIKRRRLKRAG